MASVQEFAARIKQKYPQYQDVDDSTLTRRIVEKYPEYKESVDFEPVQSRPAPSLAPSFKPSPLSFEESAQPPKRLTQPAQLQQTAATQPSEVGSLERALAPELTTGKLTGREFLTAGLEIAGAPARLAGAVGEKMGTLSPQKFQRKALGLPEKDVSEKGILDLAGESETGLLSPVRQKVEQATEDLPGAVRVPARLATSVVTGLLEDPAGMISGPASALKKIPSKGVPKSALKTKEGFRLSPQQAAKSPERELRELRIQQSPRKSDIPEAIEQQNIEQLQKLIEKKLREAGSVGDISQAPELVRTTGERLETALQKTKEDIGEQFGKIETESIKPLKKKALPGKTEYVSKTIESKLLDPVTGSPIKTKEIVKKIKTDASKLIDKELAKKGFKKGSNLSEKFGVSSEAIKKAMAFKDDLGSAETIGDLVNVRRNIRSKLKKERQREGVFGQLTKDDIFLDNIDGELGKEVVKAIEKTAGKESAEVLRLINELYAKNRNFVTGLTKKIPVGKNFGGTKIIDSVKKLSKDDLFKLNQLKNEPEFAPVMEEMQRGIFESIVSKSINAQTGKISPDKIVTQWKALKASVDPKELFNAEFVDDMDGILESLSKTKIGNIKRLNPSGSGKAILKGQAKPFILDALDALTASVARIGVKHYYETGKTIPESFTNILKIAGESVGTPENVKNIRKLVASRVTLDELLGVESEKEKEPKETQKLGTKTFLDTITKGK